MLYSVKREKDNINLVMTEDQLIRYSNIYCSQCIYKMFGEIEEFNNTLDEAIDTMTQQFYTEDNFTIGECNV